MNSDNQDIYNEDQRQDDITIVAQATSSGRAGVGILRISGRLATVVAEKILGKKLKPRVANYLPFCDQDSNIIDQGIAIYFKAPHSFTGEDVLELQGHGGQVVLDLLLKQVLMIDGVRLAQPGEFSQRAFLNNKIDLTQAEAIADLIDASSEQAAKAAMNSMQGVFSNMINEIVDKLINLRSYVEADIDFSDEEIDFLADGRINQNIVEIKQKLIDLKQRATQGKILRDGMKIVIAGLPNAGKSSLLNALVGDEVAIVTDIEGTTRDVLRQHIHIQGMPLHIIDTAGLRESLDQVEQIGIKRAWDEIAGADRILFIIDSQNQAKQQAEIDKLLALMPPIGITKIYNKIDLTAQKPQLHELVNSNETEIYLSAKENSGIELLTEHLKQVMGYQSMQEGAILARRRHLVAIDKALETLESAEYNLNYARASELLAEDLRYTQLHLSEITGKFTADDLLGNIFSSFCIGK